MKTIKSFAQTVISCTTKSHKNNKMKMPLKYSCSSNSSAGIRRTILGLTLHRTISMTGSSFILILASLLSPTIALTCVPCSLQNCPAKLDCEGGTTVDVCGCCLECARVVNESCGGPYFMNGKCDKDLICVITPSEGQIISGEESGICKEIPSSSDKNKTNCEGVRCLSHHDFEELDSSLEGGQAECPDDSVAVTSRRQPLRQRNCCPASKLHIPETSCQCHPCSSWSSSDSKEDSRQDRSRQDASSPCEPGFIRILISEGLGVPGQCCDVFECVEHTLFCEHVQCEEDLMFPPICPEDSYLLPALETQDGCCFVQQGCACKSKGQCPGMECTGGLQKRIKKLGTGEAGSCCDEYDCINGSNPICMHNGKSYHDGETWQTDSCTTCECKGGLSFCLPRACPAVPRCSWMGTPPGECCPICKGCVSQSGDLYANGAVWKQDSCVTCHCSGGQVYCQSQMCFPGCVNPRIVPGECCPVCDDIPAVPVARHCPDLSNCSLMCVEGYRKDSNSCYQCSCVEDYDAEECDLACPGGFAIDDAGQQLCKCAESLLPEIITSTTTTSSSTQPQSSSHSTTPISTLISSSSSPAVSSPVSEKSTTLKVNPVLNDTNNAENPDAEKIQSNLSSSTPTVQNISTTSSPVVFSSTQPVDRTTNHSVICSPMLGCSRQCAYGYALDHNGCETCRCYKCPTFDCTKKCLMGFALNEEGCRLCKCLGTGFSETTISAVTPWMPPLGGRHCSSADGQRMDEGQSWWDGCRKCFCHEGHEMCALITCPPLRCTNPIMRLGSCCLSCPGEDVGPIGPLGTSACYSADGRYFVEGETWMLDECTQCICHQGAALCAIDSCPPVLCNHPVVLPHTCCPVCPGSSGHLIPATSWKDSLQKVCRTSSGKHYTSGDTWRVNDCQSCVCREGQIHCYFQTCPVLSCTKIIQKKGQCCPLCLDAREKTCSHGGEIYSINENWIINDCTKCTCVESGQVLCTVTQCDAESGSRSSCDLVYQPGICCPVCADNGEFNRTRGHFDDKDSFAIVIHPAVLVLAILVMILSFIIILLLIYRRRRTRRYWLPSSTNAAMMTSISLTNTSTSSPLPNKKPQYSITPSLGKTTPVSCGYSEANDSPSTVLTRQIDREFNSTPYDATPYTTSTKLSTSSNSLKRSESPSISSLCGVVVKEDREFDEEDSYSCSKLNNDALYEQSPPVYTEKFPVDELSATETNNYNIDNEQCNSTNPVDNQLRNLPEQIIECDEDSDEALDSAADMRFESSKQLIDKKRKNRRSTGDELERQAARRLLMSPLDDVPSPEREEGKNATNRRSW